MSDHAPGLECDQYIPHYHHKGSPGRITWSKPITLAKDILWQGIQGNVIFQAIEVEAAAPRPKPTTQPRPAPTGMARQPSTRTAEPRTEAELWQSGGDGDVLHLDGPVAIAQSDTDPGDMGEPRVFTSDGTTYVTVPSFHLWAIEAEAAAPAGSLDVETLGQAMEDACDALSVTSLSPADAPVLCRLLRGKRDE